VKSRFGVLHTLGTLSLILAWVLLILGIVLALVAWFGISQLMDQLMSAIDLPESLSVLSTVGPLAGLLPPLFWGIGGFLQFFVIGKVLHLLVALDDKSESMAQEIKRQASNQEALVAATLISPAQATPADLPGASSSG
jgi:uncharacterized membrane protein